MANCLVFDMPVEQGLAFMSAGGANGMNTKRQFFDDMVNEANGIFLMMARVYFQCPNPCCAIDGSVLIAL